MKISALPPNPENPRKISKEQLDSLGRALREFGDLGGIVFNIKTNQVVGGHQRLKILPADLEIKITKEYSKPTRTGTVREGHVFFEGERFQYREVKWSLAREKAANLAANKHGGEFDLGKVGEWLKELNDLKFDVSLTGFDFEPEKTGNTDPDSVPHVEGPVKTKRGDIYELGRHRLMCGDSTAIGDVERLMNGEKADTLCWDPPFNVGFEYEGFYKGKDNQSPDQYCNFLTSCLENFLAFSMKEYSAFVWQGMLNIRYFSKWFEPYDWRLICVTKNFIQARPVWLQWATDPVIAWTTRDMKKSVDCRDWFLANTANTVQTNDRVISGQHPCPRSIDVCEYFISNWGIDNVVDLSGGSGSTLIACEKTNRRCFMMEIDPHYCDVIVKRWEEYTGQKAKLIGKDASKKSLRKKIHTEKNRGENEIQS